MNDKRIHQVSFVKKDNQIRVLENKKLNEVREAIEDCENAKKGKDTSSKLNVFKRTFIGLRRAINTFLVIGPWGEVFNLASNVITGSFFRHYNSYFSDRLKDTIKSQDLMEFQQLKREAKELNASLLKAKAKIKDKEKKQLIQEKVDNLNKKIKEAENQIKKV